MRALMCMMSRGDADFGVDPEPSFLSDLTISSFVTDGSGQVRLKSVDGAQAPA
jgi:hypothetical protein